MRFMNREKSEILHKLVYLANGDTALVDRAIRASADADGRSPLEQVIDYIERNRVPDDDRNVA